MNTGKVVPIEQKILNDSTFQNSAETGMAFSKATLFPQYTSVLHDRLLLDRHSGHLYRKAAGMKVEFPLLLVRHGETNGNLNGTFQGQADIPISRLNERGKLQARQAAERLYQECVDLFDSHLTAFAEAGKLIVVHSPLQRARDTANAFLAEFEAQTGIALPVQTERKFAEISFGKIDGLTFEAIEDAELRDCAKRFRTCRDATIDWNGTGESYLEMIYRANTLLEQLNQQYHEQRVLLIAFSHGAFINALRVAIGDKALIEEDGMIAFTKHGLKNCETYWVGDSLSQIRKIAAHWRMSRQ